MHCAQSYCVPAETYWFNAGIEVDRHLYDCQPRKTWPTCRLYSGADKSLARPTSRCILFDGENISFNASLVIYIRVNSTNIPPIVIINRIYENQYLLSL